MRRQSGRSPRSFSSVRRTESLRVVEHEGEPFGGIGRVERHVRAARLEDGQQPHHHVRRPADAQAHQHLGADAHGAQAAGQAVGPGVELAVSERLAGAASGRRPPESAPPAFRSGDGRGSRPSRRGPAFSRSSRATSPRFCSRLRATLSAT